VSCIFCNISILVQCFFLLLSGYNCALSNLLWLFVKLFIENVRYFLFAFVQKVDISWKVQSQLMSINDLMHVTKMI